MPTGVQIYPNGLPHPPMQVRRRIALELLILAALTSLYLILVSPRPLAMDIGMALVGLGLVGFTADYTRTRIWGPPPDAEFDRRRRCAVNMFVSTSLAVAGVVVYGIFSAYSQQGRWSDVAARFLNWRLPIALILYVPWALLQQTLFQFYLLGRLRALLPFATPLILSVINGIAYGSVHLAVSPGRDGPDLELAVLTMIGGAVWSYSYHRDRYVLPIAISHAVLGSTFFYWARGSDVLLNFFGR